MDIGGNKVKAVQLRLDMINTQIDQTTGHINKANVAIKTAKRYKSVFYYSALFNSHSAKDSRHLDPKILALAMVATLYKMFSCLLNFPTYFFSLLIHFLRAVKRVYVLFTFLLIHFFESRPIPFPSRMS